MVNIKIQACKQIHSEASQEDPRLEAGKYGQYTDTGLQADPQQGQSRGPKVRGRSVWLLSKYRPASSYTAKPVKRTLNF